MTRPAARSIARSAVASIEMTRVCFETPNGRSLFADLELRMGNEHVALVGRNGAGKSTLLRLIAGTLPPTSGRILTRSTPCYVPQLEESRLALSRGEQRLLELRKAKCSGAEILLLDEPTLHLDDEAVDWVRDWLTSFPGCAVVATHDRRLLEQMRHFFVISERGCHYFGGTLEQLERHLESEHEAQELRYTRNLNRLAEQEAHTALVSQRRARKKQRGRCSELDRATARIRLNRKRGEAQVSQGRLAEVREARLAALRRWTQATRRALSVELGLELCLPPLPAWDGRPIIRLAGVSVTLGTRSLFEDVSLAIGRERIAVVGPNGAGKTTLLEVISGQRRPSAGVARAEPTRLGLIEQGGRNWLMPDSLRQHLQLSQGLPGERIAELLVAHRFPLALAERPLDSLSPGERARAALIAVLARSPAPELLILDEPTFSLDLLGQHALARVLRNWQGGLVVASHDRAFLAQIDWTRTLTLR
ncbi:MAG TPA: ATP-binding cassette domain-containing protein [Polyangiaceae bacterium]